MNGGNAGARRSSDERPLPGPDSPDSPDGEPTSRVARVEPLDDHVTRVLLGLALQRESGPFAALLDRIELPDGETWFNDAIARVCDESGIGAPEFDSTVRGLDALRRLKSHCRPRQDASPQSSTAGGDQHLAALAGYALAVAMAQALHGVILSGRPRAEWESLFRLLADRVSQPWSSHFLRAAEVTATDRPAPEA